jgi:hypothetical protein
MAEGLTSLAARLQLVFDETPDPTPEELKMFREQPKSLLEKAGIDVDSEVLARFQNLDDEEFTQSVRDLKEISRWIPNPHGEPRFALTDEECYALLARLAPFLGDLLFLEEDPELSDCPNYV